jgi:hypothetical protein
LKLSHAFVEAKRAHNLPSVSWLDLGELVVSFSPSLKARRADGANARLRIGEDKIPT